MTGESVGIGDSTIGEGEVEIGKESGTSMKGGGEGVI